MIINNAPVNQAIVSNVGEIGEFRIRNSAKAFSILSSGLYANKIRAIIRELSCNAVDSHTAAGKADTPFDVHLPNTLEPWFSIRDYGTGLSHEQVTQIYTTYFESTKTESNAFIGALGLGSKSPFSYTDNFTVTAIKDGKRGIYSAFINEQGVPSIALMMTEETDEPAGVEVKFSVNDNWDFGKFADEARQVYTYFKLRPVVTGNQYFEFQDVAYKTENIVPGVHHTDTYHSRAVMGNIAYPIDVPNAETNLDGLHNLLGCGLEMHFDIGELDFQASREGLSYIPSTIAAIKKKLEALNAQLAIFIADEANKIDNLWERAMFLDEKKSDRLWQKAVEKYVADTKFKLMNSTPHYGVALIPFKIEVEQLAKRFNIQIRAFNKSRGYSTVSNANPNNDRHATLKDANGYALYVSSWYFNISKGVRIVINDTKVGASNRAKAFFKDMEHGRDKPYTYNVYVLEAVDKAKPMNIKALKRILCNPPADVFMNASDMPELARASGGGGTAKNVTIMKMEERGTGSYYRRDEMVWRDAGKLSANFNDTDTYYYIPMSGYNIESEVFKGWSANSIHQTLNDSGIKSLQVTLYGVRKGDIETIKSKKNWVNIEEFAKKELNKMTKDQLKTLAMSMIDNQRLVRYNESIVKHLNKTSPFYVASMKVKNATKIDMSRSSLESLCKAFGVTIDVQQHIDDIAQEHNEIYARYPLLNCLSAYHGNDEAVAEYINAMDVVKK